MHTSCTPQSKRHTTCNLEISVLLGPQRCEENLEMTRNQARIVSVKGVRLSTFENPPPLTSERPWGQTEEARKEAVQEVEAEGGTRIDGHVCILGRYPGEFAISTCAMCRTLAGVRTRLIESPINVAPWPYELHVVSAVYVHFASFEGAAVNLHRILEARDILDTRIFAVDPKPPHIFFYARTGFWSTEHSGSSGHLYPVATKKGDQQRRFWGRRLHPDRIDYKVLRSWIDSCKTYHKESCAIEFSNSPARIPHFQLVDCHRRKVIPATLEMQYVALSYVWGSGIDSKGAGVCSDSRVSATLPVIEDAMTVTKELGLRYLWVDQHCIIQSDKQLKMEQIRSMDAVYSQAEATIIACAGEDGSFGLPGVSNRPRIPQPSVQIQDQLLVSSGPRLQDLLPLSKWASRGWTYQEGLLSRRRLIFTEYQTYFECGLSQCCEAIAASPEILFHWQPVEQAHSMASQKFRVFPLHNRLTPPHLIFDRIREYSSKQLTYCSDALNGILGILSVFEKHTPSTFSLWGIPVLTQTETTRPRLWLDKWSPFVSKQIKRDPNQALTFGLRWLTRPGKRNPDFPSWSWAGWAGPLQVHFPIADAEWAIPEMHPETKFWVERHDGQLIEWTEYYTRRNDLKGLPPISPFLHIKGLSVRLQFEYGPISGNNEAFPHEPSEYGLHVRLHINELQISICPLNVTKLEDDEASFVDRLLQKSWDAPILSYRGEPLAKTHAQGGALEISYETLTEKKQTDFELLVLESIGESYERLGMVKLTFPDHLELPSPGSLRIERKTFRIA